MYIQMCYDVNTFINCCQIMQILTGLHLRLKLMYFMSHFQDGEFLLLKLSERAGVDSHFVTEVLYIEVIKYRVSRGGTMGGGARGQKPP